MTIQEEHQEVDIFTTKPSLKDSWGKMLLGIILIPLFGLGLIYLAWVWLDVKNSSYRLTTQRLFLKTGFISKKVQETELYRIQDVSFKQGIIQRVLGVGDITIFSNDPSTPEWKMTSVKNPEQLKETIRKAYRVARKVEGVRSAEHVH
jgi:uncharacterized membrane protein YdbT with pleckstrin-like domain